MTLAADDRHALARIEGALRRSDPKLAAMLATFNRLHQSERMPARELLPRPRLRLRRPRLRRPIPRQSALRRSGAQPGVRRPGPQPGPRRSEPQPDLRRSGPRQPAAGSWAGAGTGSWLGRWRLYPPLPPGSRQRSGFRPAEIVSLVMATCALGVMVVLFTVLGHTRPAAATQTRSSSCTPTVLMACQPGTGPAGPASRKGAAG